MSDFVSSPAVRRVRAAFFGDAGWGGDSIAQVYGPRLEEVRARAEVFPTRITRDNIEAHLPALRDLEAIFSTWGMFALSPAQLDALPRLKAVFYAAGSVRHFAAPLLERDIAVISAWAANAVPVAEWTLAQILLSNKGFWRNAREYGGAAPSPNAFRGRGNYGAAISILGAGQIGRRVIELLRPFRLQILVFDPFLSAQAAAQLGAEKVTLEEAFARGAVVSNHLANLPATQKMLRGAHFASMPPDATFINTGRGQTVHETEMAQVLRARPDLFALLDVTDPEPCPPDSPLRALPNVLLSAHLAGSIGDEVVRMADTVLEEFDLWRSGQPLRYAVTPQLLETMA